MNRKVIITSAVTGAGDTVPKSEHVPVTPEQIAASAIGSARAGAAVVHVHVRNVETGRGSRDVALYREAVKIIRESDVDFVLNLTAGMGGDLLLDQNDPTKFIEGTDLVNAYDRLPHVEELLPDICTLDCGSLNFGDGNQLYVSTPDMLRAGAKRIQELGVKPEMEIFDTGHLWFATQLVKAGLIDPPPLFQLCMDIPWGAPADPLHLAAMVHRLPEGSNWAAFAHRSDADALGGAVDPDGRPCAGRAGGQPLSVTWCVGDQRDAGRARRRHHPQPRCRGCDARRGTRDPRTGG